MKTNLSTQSRAFTIVEIMVVVTIMGILAVGLLPGFRGMMKNKAITAEQNAIAALGDEIIRTFPLEDWNLNIACMADYMTYQGGGATNAQITSFGAATPTDTVGIAFQVSAQNWAAKLALGRGDTITPEASGDYVINNTHNLSLRGIAVNALDEPRMLIAGPTDEPTQRYILLSIVAPTDMGLVIPSPTSSGQYTAWFNSLWNQSWTSADVPTGIWGSLLSANDLAAWSNGSGHTTNLDRMIVRTIVQKKYPVTLNQSAGGSPCVIDTVVYVRDTTTSPTSGSSLIWTVASQGSYTTTNTLAASPSSAPGILAGRWILVGQKPTASPSQPFNILQTQMATAPVVFTLQ